MAEKHKTKYKSPKDLEKSTKPNTRKDIKDYTGDEAHGMVPNLTKGVQPLVVRKYATDVLDDVENMVPKIVDHIYKKVEEGEYSPEHARKVFEKMQLAGTEEYIKKLERIDHVAITNSLVKPENEETLKESISKLSEEQKEQVIRKYVRNKIAKILRENYVFEQEDATDIDTPEPADVDVDTPDTEADVDTPDTEADIDVPETEVEADAEAAVDSDTSSPAPTSFSGGGGSSSPSPSPTPTSTDTAETTSDTSSTETVNKMKFGLLAASLEPFDFLYQDVNGKKAHETLEENQRQEILSSLKEDLLPLFEENKYEEGIEKVKSIIEDLEK